MNKPIKTEYRGVVFDSKSEAVFARSMDLAGVLWSYQREHAGHMWDFSIRPKVGQSGVCTLVEYKPSPPTQTYIENLTKKMSKKPRESVLIWGSPWDTMRTWWQPSECCYQTYPIFTTWGKYGWGDFIRLADNGEKAPVSCRHITEEMFGITDRHARSARKYRFDLMDRDGYR